MDYTEKLQRCHEYVEALEEERRKIQVFQRELPLCLELVTQAIEACKRELSGTTTEYMHGQSECSVQTSSDGIATRPPVLEEFIPIKRTHSSSDNDYEEEEEEDDDDDNENDDKEHHSHNKRNDKNIKDKDKNSSADHKKKSDWLRSVQLWNQSADPPLKEDLPRKIAVSEVKRNGGAFQPFQKEKSVGKNNQTITKTPSPVPASATSSTEETKTGGTGNGSGNGGGGSGKKDEKESSQRKQRRCWSPELHRRFLHALQQLGGSHAATPKQIRELMKVDGLTNDEVKSHLQKYRLHTRRPSPTIHNNNNPQAPQFVVVGGIWVPPADYATVAAGTTTTSGETATIAAANGLYAPVASRPPASSHLVQKLEHTQSEGRDSRSEGSPVHSRGGRSNSPATSSSTHTTTNSPLF
ncbi:hypothetical protein JCGZ_18291 [Jatropha curcas]|uniref:HTH myb-type domain-containing protein n=1 Tax=Jatropha curcas TaxID=180498 RepID=A0A067KAT1_JATCU|nr:transcription factor HHO3 [Jatropha curcas]KDP29370.1 hypothetical protein JCGZ_18291 [Jatropha curcas]